MHQYNTRYQERLRKLRGQADAGDPDQPTAAVYDERNVEWSEEELERAVVSILAELNDYAAQPGPEMEYSDEPLSEPDMELEGDDFDIEDHFLAWKRHW